MKQKIKIESQSIHHLGLISSMCDEIGLVKVVDSLIPVDSRKKLTVGECVKLMIINSLGFTGKALYLTSTFYEKKPIERFLHKEISAKDVNDDVLGRALDAIHEYNPSLLFAQIAYRAAKHFKIDTSIVHLDTSSKVMFGAYDEEEDESNIVKYGNSKDKRPDLKQIMFSLLVTNEGNFPLMGGAIEGNTSDAKHFRQVAKTLKENICFDKADEVTLIGDAAFYSKETIQEAQFIKWITRVPETSKDAKEALVWALKQSMVQISDTYSFVEMESHYGGIDQRWLIVRSKAAREKAVHSVNRAVQKEKEAFESALKKLNEKGFSCEADAERALKKETKKLKYHVIDEQNVFEKERYLRPGKPKNNDPKKIIFYATATIIEDQLKVNNEIEKRSLFILATNELNSEKLSSVSILEKYKDQNKVERGFRFLKNPLCMAPAIYLKKQTRIEALAVIMLISLLIYTAIEHSLRKALKEKNETISNQVKKPTQKPTAKWIFEMFEDVAIVTIRMKNSVTYKITNLNDMLIKILSLLGNRYRQMYLL